MNEVNHGQKSRTASGFGRKLIFGDLYIRKMVGKRTYTFYRAVDLQFTSLK